MTALVGVAGAVAAVAPPVAGAAPPVGRAYELVSPADDPSGTPAGVATDATPMPGKAGGDGDALVYGAAASVGMSLNGVPNALIFGRRTPSGWIAETAIRSVDEGETATEVIKADSKSSWVAPDAHSVVFNTGQSLGGTNLLASARAIYRSTSPGLSAPTWLSEPNGAGVLAGGVAASSYASRDLSVVAFNSFASLPGGAPGTSGVFVHRNGAMELASVLPDGTPAPNVSTLANATAGGLLDSVARTFRNTVSADGRFVLFVGGATSGNFAVASGGLFVRDLQTNVTRQLAAPNDAQDFRNGGWLPGFDGAIGQWTVPNGFVFAAEDAPVAYFRSAANLAPGATGSDSNKLYRANLVSGHLDYFPELNGPPVAVSPDGREVMFVRQTGHATGAPWELRFWTMDEPLTSTLLGTIPGSNNNGNASRLAAQFQRMDDGGWAFVASGSLDPARPNDKLDALQLYRWRQDEASPTCLTCVRSAGPARTSGVNLGIADSARVETVRFMTGTPNNYSRNAIGQVNRAVSVDGRIIAFDSPDQLVDEDQNQVRDVYIWDANAAPEDRLQLVTSGVGLSPSYYVDMSPNGDNVFFTTQDGLVDADRDLAYDVYVARVGGGFPESPASCVAEACRPPRIGDPVTALITSNILTPPTVGTGKPVQVGVPKFRVRSVRTASSRVTVRVDAPAAGRLRVSGANVRTVNRSVKKAGTYTLRVPLRAAAKRRVTSGRTVRVGLRTEFRPRAAGKSQRVTTSVSVRKGR